MAKLCLPVDTTVTGPGTLRFNWKVSSEKYYDSLLFSIDDKSNGFINGEIDWEEKSYNIDPGTHTLKWSYHKNFMKSEGSDRAWVDKVEFSGTETFDFTLSVPLSSGNVIAGKNISTTVNAGLLDGSGSVYLSAIGLPQGVTARFSPQTCSPPCSSTLTFSTAQNTPEGKYLITISGTGGRIIRFVTYILTVQSIPLEHIP